MLDWFYSLTSPEQVFWVIAIISTAIFILVMISTFLGADTDVDMDMDGGAGFHFFTFKNAVAFFAIFGWVGIAGMAHGYSLTLTIVIAFICGLIMMVIAAALFYYINKLNASGTLDYHNAIHSTGEVYLEVGKKRSRMGKVQISVQGTLREMEALTDDEKDIKRGALVIVESVTENGVLIVKPLNK